MSGIYFTSSATVSQHGYGEDELSYAINAAKEKLTSLLQERFPDRDVSKISLESAVMKIWNNSALGCPALGHFYTQALISGYRIEFRIDDESYVMHTDAKANRIVSPNFPSKENLSE